jgi:hypothetical protein
VIFILLVIRLIQKDKLDIAYSWMWLGIALILPLIVLSYDQIVAFSAIIGIINPTITVLLIVIGLLMLVCLQYSLVISHQKRQIKKISQQIALMEKER